MTFLENLVRTPLAKALGSTVFHSLWQGAVTALILLAVLSVIRTSRARYTAACMAIVANLAGFAVTFAHFAPSHTQQAATIISALPSAATDAITGARGLHGGFSPEDILPWLAPFWLSGVIFFQLRTAASWISTRRLRSRGVCLAPDFWQQRLERLRERLSLSQPVTILETCFAGVPVVIGHLRPVILVPMGMLTSMPASAIEAILLHELAHIHRRDYLFNMVQTVAECFLFYHPVVWWISHVIRTERENCCDDVAVAISGNAPEYAAALATLEQNRWDANPSVLAATGGNLMKRIRRLLLPCERSGAALAPVIPAAFLTLAAALAMAGWQAQTPEPAPVPAQSADRYAEWLQEDAAYIITDAERTAFRALATDAERDYFIQQFWLRRDPTPGTPENEFKEEHYRRIARAVQMFSTATLSGWRTDRGRIYIVYGPPDEIDSHPSGGVIQRSAADGGGSTEAYPFEDWRYRYIDGIGDDVLIEFVDKENNGEYHMALDPNAKDAREFIHPNGKPQ
jgi:GWxTD domain-containing protein